jgi:hypothetical protein
LIVKFAHECGQFIHFFRSVFGPQVAETFFASSVDLNESVNAGETDDEQEQSPMMQFEQVPAEGKGKQASK